MFLSLLCASHASHVSPRLLKTKRGSQEFDYLQPDQINLPFPETQGWRIWGLSLSFLRGCWRFVLRTAWRFGHRLLILKAYKQLTVFYILCLWVTVAVLPPPQIFTEDLTEVETLPRHKVLHFLKESFKELAIPYLEHIIDVWEDKGPEFHNVLIQLYLERVQSLMKQYLNSLPEGLSRAPVDKIFKKKTKQTLYCLVSFLHQNTNNSPDVLFHWRKRLWRPWQQHSLFPRLNNKHTPNNCTLNLWSDFRVITFVHMDPVRAVSCSQLFLAAPQTKPMPELIMKSIPLRLFAPLNPRPETVDCDEPRKPHMQLVSAHTITAFNLQQDPTLWSCFTACDFNVLLLSDYLDPQTNYIYIWHYRIWSKY